VQSALFENNVFLVAQHMMQFAVTGKAADPMPGRISAWGVYDVFTVKDGEQIFLAVVSDTPMGDLLRRLWPGRPEGRRTPGHQQRPRARARLDDAPAARTLSRP
jgi:crotonobetainyl-CoA:carnitine CoA-transferase CaiB-like acyl-CoA transferase